MKAPTDIDNVMFNNNEKQNKNKKSPKTEPE